MKQRVLAGHLVLLLFLSVFLVSCENRSDKDWNRIVDSGEQTNVVIAVATENDALLSYLEEDFAGYMKEKHHQRIVVKQVDIHQVIAKLSEEKILVDEGQDEHGSYDVLVFGEDGYAELLEKHLLYGPFADDVKNMDLINVYSPSCQYRDALPNGGYFVPIARQQLTFLYSEDIFYDIPETYSEMIDTLGKLKGKTTYPDPRYTKEGEAFLMGLVEEKVLMEPFVVPDRDLKAFEEEVRLALRPLVKNRVGLMNAGTEYPVEIEQLFTDGKTYFSMNMDFLRISEKIKNYEYPDTTNTFVLQPVGTYTMVAVVPFNSLNKTGAMVAISELLSPSVQASLYGTGLVSVYYSRTPEEAQESLNKIKLHRAISKNSTYVAASGIDFDKELRDIVIAVWEDMVLPK